MFLRAVGKSADFDFTEFITFGADIRARSVDDLVQQTVRACPKRDLQELCYFGHGVGGVIKVGEDRIGGIARPRQEPHLKLASLRSILYRNAALIFCVCEGGKNQALLSEIARLIDHPVYACTGDVRPCAGLLDRGWWSGKIIEALPNGRCGEVSKIPDPPIILA